MLLADVFENFRALCQNYYKIDPCHAYTAPGLAWQACLRMTKVLEIITPENIKLELFGLEIFVGNISNDTRLKKAELRIAREILGKLPDEQCFHLMKDLRLLVKRAFYDRSGLRDKRRSPSNPSLQEVVPFRAMVVKELPQPTTNTDLVYDHSPEWDTTGQLQ
ncbi:hypothetical protein NPIL_38741 [Nephila pilipes]|uniref:Uncharacterized protein n=1 Tax=Nephila pilipes TaxID=299642 RepID=A0A8X6PDC5_NEPPI|nr:hypothetical protein NPIL_38741 [Nephila pilipes]